MKINEIVINEYDSEVSSRTTANTWKNKGDTKTL